LVRNRQGDIPRGFTAPGGNKNYCLQLIKNLFGQKQAGRVWNKHLHKGLTKIGFEQSAYEECLYFRDDTILLLYVDDLIVMNKTEADIDKAFEDLQQAGFDIKCEGSLSEYLGIQIQRKSNGNIHLTQPTVIRQIINSVMNIADFLQIADVGENFCENI